MQTPGSRWGEIGWGSQYARWLGKGDAGLLTDRMHVRGSRGGELSWELDGLDLTGYGSDMRAGWFGVRNTWRWHRYEEDYYVSTDSMIPGSSILYGLPTRFWTTTAMGARLRQELAGEMGL